MPRIRRIFFKSCEIAGEEKSRYIYCMSFAVIVVDNTAQYIAKVHIVVQSSFFVLFLYKKYGEVLMDIHFNRLTAKYKKEKVKNRYAGLLNFL